MYKPDTPAECLSHNLRLFCTNNNFSYSDAAAYMGVRESAFQNWLRKQSMPIPEDAKKLEKVFGAPLRKICSIVITKRLTEEHVITIEDIYPYNLMLDAIGFDYLYSGHNAIDKYEEDSIKDINMEYMDVTPREIFNIIASLTQREQMVIQYRYRDGLTLQETALKMQVTKERIRQIEAKAVRKINRHVIVLLRDKKTKDESYNQMVQDINVLRTQLNSLREALSNHPEIDDHAIYDPVYAQILRTTIKELDFSVRTYNCLLRAGIRNVKEIVEYDETFYHIRNLGKRSIGEIIHTIDSLHIPYKWDEDLSHFVEVSPK